MDRKYATDNGFYIGDKVEVGKDKRVTYIEHIMTKGIDAHIGVNEETYKASLVQLTDGSITLDLWLTRIG